MTPKSKKNKKPSVPVTLTAKVHYGESNVMDISLPVSLATSIPALQERLMTRFPALKRATVEFPDGRAGVFEMIGDRARRKLKLVFQYVLTVEAAS